MMFLKQLIAERISEDAPESFEEKISRKAEHDAQYALKYEYPYKTVSRWQQTMRRNEHDPDFYGGDAAYYYGIYLSLFREAYGELAGLGHPFDGELPQFTDEVESFHYDHPAVRKATIV